MLRKPFLLISLGILAVGIAPAAAGAATIDVNTTTDEYTGSNGACSLREAVDVTNTDVAGHGCPGGTGDDLIVLPAGTYNLTRLGIDDTNSGGDLDVIEDQNLTIRGNGVVQIVSSGVDRVLDHNSGGGDLELSNLTLRGGNAANVNDGGGIINRLGDLMVQRSTIRGNTATVDGGGLANYATATLVNVTISDNETNNNGGGVYTAGGATTAMRNVTIASNEADADSNLTGGGGGIANASMGNISTFNTIIADNTDGSPDPSAKAPDCETQPSFFPRHTLIEAFTASTCLVGFNPGTNIVGQDPKLAPLALNGGTTPTHALREGSPAIDNGGTAAPDLCEPTDQRGVVRPQRAGCDLGAYELRPLPPVRCDGKVATIVGTNGRNVIRGTAGRDVIAARGGNDRVIGRGGNDLICGGKGKDVLEGRAGKDKLLGQAGPDTLRGGPGRDLLKGGAGADKLFGGPGRDKLRGGPGRDTQTQ